MTTAALIFAMLLCGAIILYLDDKKHQASMDRMRELSQRILKLELEKRTPTKIDFIEFTDTFRQMTEDHEAMKKRMTNVMNDFNTTVLRLITTFRQDKKPKEKGH